MAAPSPKFTIYRDDEQWLPFFKWFWMENPPVKAPDGFNTMTHGAYPARWIAWLSAKVHTR